MHKVPAHGRSCAEAVGKVWVSLSETWVIPHPGTHPRQCQFYCGSWTLLNNGKAGLNEATALRRSCMSTARLIQLSCFLIPDVLCNFDCVVWVMSDMNDEWMMNWSIVVCLCVWRKENQGKEIVFSLFLTCMYLHQTLSTSYLPWVTKFWCTLVAWVGGVSEVTNDGGCPLSAVRWLALILIHRCLFFPTLHPHWSCWFYYWSFSNLYSLCLGCLPSHPHLIINLLLSPFSSHLYFVLYLSLCTWWRCGGFGWLCWPRVRCLFQIFLSNHSCLYIDAWFPFCCSHCIAVLRLTGGGFNVAWKCAVDDYLCRLRLLPVGWAACDWYT